MTGLPMIAETNETDAENYCFVIHFSYAISEAEHVELGVFNTLGEACKTLVNDRQTAGLHNVFFSADGLPDGMYFYRMSAGKRTQTGTMVIAR